MEKCGICGCSDFYNKSGYFFCATCQSTYEGIKEQILEVRVDDTTKLRKMRISNARRNRIDKELGWTSWELYNFILIGLTNELIELGAPVDIKVTVLQLWARYLGKLEVAFTSTKQKLMPKLARRYKKRDAEIISGKVFVQKRIRKRKKIDGSVTSSKTSAYQSEGSSLRELNRNKKLMSTADYDRFMQSQASSEGDALSGFNQSVYSVQSSTGRPENYGRVQFNSSARKEAKKVKSIAKKVPRNKRNKFKTSYITSQYKIGPELITPMKLWAILYLSLRIHNNPIQLGDMLRYAREGHLSYYKLDHLIPPEVTLTKSDLNFLSRTMDTYITHKGGVSLYGERLVALSPPKMKFDKKSYIPNYEGRVMAFVVVILKTLLALDGITEYEISNFADKINSVISDEGVCMTRLFSFREWQRHIECRRTVLANMHFPTKLKYDPNIPIVSSLYIKFLEAIHSKTDKEQPELTTRKHLIPRELIHAMKQCITNVNYIDLPLNEVNVFAPSLTPHRAYLQQLLEYPQYDFPNILKSDFYSTKIGYMTKSESIYELAQRYEIQLDFIDSNLHFIEKTVPLYEQAKMTSVKDLKDYIEIHDFMNEEIEVEQKEDFTDYLHKKMPCQLKIDEKKKQYYNDAQSTNINVKAPLLLSFSEFIFDETFSDGKLSILDTNDNKDFTDGDSQDAYVNDTFLEETKLSSKFCKAYNINFSSTEKTAMSKNVCFKKKQKRKPMKGVDGKFIKQNDIALEHDVKNVSQDHSINCIKQTKMISANNSEIENTLPEIPDICNLNNTFMYSDFTKIKIGHDDQPENGKVFGVTMDETFHTFNKRTENALRLFRPFKDYWMYHCNFSRVKPKNFELFERTLPRSFRWLLNECASIVEMSPEDLYEEICLVEAYYTNVSEKLEICTNANDDNHNKTHFNAIMKRW
ncbi:TATA box-binding protein-associated factor RNA polymerase I subunit B isoform X2 [Odontomachus brunneus]|uniref:TATA box-binding protein-associated factor RNA polymerase I subunit B isoform X2 n=1 Tax=Odontomachus brunneus TaxID=486640 RepID=UPI0013F17F91|nr:TATA box-binding protein-associated factor RNA polymerase I subunit B isoform X2 [Odontomachus brunneus]